MNRWTGRVAMSLAVLTLVACSPAYVNPTTYNRHRLSEITLPRDGAGGSTAASGMFFFDVTVTSEFAEGSEAAEAERMKWLEEWLRQRSMCLAGYEVLQKRKFGYMEDNPARRDLRYEVRCREG